ncbi:thiamine pyrophosphate-binding protein [Streptomyces sp. NPDC051546]|uniref:thiamine pyrophosphate-binding protein n=1 Tax=Streptomyces sp. NPDC051546 TaxID=3365655 RepID=UPI00378952F3
MSTVTASPTVARDLLNGLVEHGFTLATGVPCSLLAGAFTLLEAAPGAPGHTGLRYVSAPREDSALGIASGAAVAGEKSVVLMQNSGLGYCLNVITSFNLIYDVPVLLIVSWRGHDGNDAVEHDVIGAELLRLLTLFALPYTVLDPSDVTGSVAGVLDQMDREQRCAVLIVREGI